MSRHVKLALVTIVGLGAIVPSTSAGQVTTRLRPPDVRFVPTPQNVVEAMLEMARVTSTDVVYDLSQEEATACPRTTVILSRAGTPR